MELEYFWLCFSYVSDCCSRVIQQRSSEEDGKVITKSRYFGRFEFPPCEVGLDLQRCHCNWIGVPNRLKEGKWEAIENRRRRREAGREALLLIPKVSIFLLLLLSVWISGVKTFCFGWFVIITALNLCRWKQNQEAQKR